MDLWTSFLAFNQNAAAYALYAIQNNLSIIFIIIGTVVTIGLRVKNEIITTVHEEQQVL